MKKYIGPILLLTFIAFLVVMAQVLGIGEFAQVTVQPGSASGYTYNADSDDLTLDASSGNMGMTIGGDEGSIAFHDGSVNQAALLKYVKSSDTLTYYTGTGASATHQWDAFTSTNLMNLTSSGFSINTPFTSTDGGSHGDSLRIQDGDTSSNPHAIDIWDGNSVTANTIELHYDGSFYFCEPGVDNCDVRAYRRVADTWTMADDVELATVLSCDSGDEKLETDANGLIVCGDNTASSEKSWSFLSRSGFSGTFYYGGYYDFGSTDNDFNPLINFGTANSSYAAHVIFICAAGGAGGTDTVVRITGTSIDDTATRTAADTQDITMDDAGAANAFYESSKKWIGQISLEKQSGPDLLCNYGHSKYWDNNNLDFTIAGLEVTWIGGANDSGFDIKILHHKSSGWTYNAGSTPTIPTAVARLQTDHNTEYEVVNGEFGAWKRTDLATAVSGSTSEGIIWQITTTSNNAIEMGNILMRITQ